MNFPKFSQIKSKSLKLKLESGKTKEFTLDLGKPLKLVKGESTIDIVYGKRKETKIMPFEVISSIPRLEKEEVILFKIWEAEDLNHKTGMRVVDEDANNGIAWQGDNEKDKANEFRVYWFGKTSLWTDRITLFKLNL